MTSEPHRWLLLAVNHYNAVIVTENHLLFSGHQIYVNAS